MNKQETIKSMVQFKEGDKVRIRQWEDMANEFGLDGAGDIDCNLGFSSYMSILCGKAFVIKSIEPSEGKTIVYGLTEHWYITTDMIEHVEKGEEKMTEVSYKNLYLEEVIKGLDYNLKCTKTYKGKLINKVYAHELVDFILKMESLGYCEADLAPYFEKDEREEE